MLITNVRASSQRRDLEKQKIWVKNKENAYLNYYFMSFYQVKLGLGREVLSECVPGRLGFV